MPRQQTKSSSGYRPGKIPGTVIIPRGDKVPEGAVPVKASDKGGETYRLGGGSSGVQSFGHSSKISIPKGQSMEDVLSAILKYAPKFAEADYQEMAKYEPLRAQLALDLASQYQPKQLSQQLSLAQQYQPGFQTLAEQLRSADRAANTSDVRTLSSQLQEIRALGENPETTSIRNNLLKTVNEDLAMGTQLSSEENRQVEQGFRASEVARGLEGGYGSTARESVARALQGQKLKTQRIGRAQSVLGQEYSAAPNAFNLTYGSPETASIQGTSQFNSGLQLPTLGGRPTSGLPNAQQGVSTGVAAQNAAASNQLAAQQASLAAQQYQNSLQFLPYLYSQLYS